MPSLPSRRIYLSYRRGSGASWARLLEHRLPEAIPNTRVLVDVDAIEPGQDFADVIRETVGSCAVLLALIGRQWATLTDSSGLRRLDHPDDSVRLEIQTAFERGVPVIPVLLDGAERPRQQELPPELHKLARLDAAVLKASDDRFGDYLSELLKRIERMLAKGQAAAADSRATPHGIRRLPGVRAREGRSVFISYRRKLSESLARLVRDDLIKHRFDTFVDLENLDSGEFEGVILSQIQAREHFIVLLEPGSLDQIGKDGDWLRREIAHALAHSRNVVPVTVKGFEFRRDLVLPPDVARLASFNAVTIPPIYFDAAMELLRTRFLKTPPNPTARP